MKRTLFLAVAALVGISTMALAQEKTEDPYQMLTEDHQKVKTMLQDIQTGGREKEQAFSELKKALKTHMDAEEKYLYPKLKESDQEMGNLSQQEHLTARKQLDSINLGSSNPDAETAKIKILATLLNNHIETEESKVFPAAKKIMTPEEQSEFAKKLKEARK